MELWSEANKTGDERLQGLRRNLQAWEGYDKERMGLDDKLAEAQQEYDATVRVYDLEGGPKDHTERLATASKMRKNIEETFKGMAAANDELAKLLGDEKRAELADEVRLAFRYFLMKADKKGNVPWDFRFPRESRMEGHSFHTA